MEDPKTEKNNKEDTLTKEIGTFGKWHVMLLLVMVVPTKFSIIWQLLATIFLAPKTIFWCEEMANSTGDMVNSTLIIKNSTCYSDCVRYGYYTEFENTIISEWDLICKRQWLANFSQTMLMFGGLVGGTAFGFFADRCGRKPAFMCACMIQIIASFATAFSPYYWIFTAVRFLVGASTTGVLLISYTILIETTEASKREIMNSITFLPTAIGEALMPVFGYYLRSWDKFSLGIAIPNLVFFIYFFLVPESPKWLVTMGKLEEASKVMTTVAKCNGLPTENMMDVAKRMAAEANNLEKQKVKATYLDLIRIPTLRSKNFCSCLIWFTLGLCYYGSQQFMGQTSTNLFATIAMAGILQIPGALLGSWCSKLMGRRLTIIILSIVFAISTGLLALPDDWFYVKLIMGSVGTCMSMAAFSVMYMYTSELFPTVTRNMALAASSTLSRIGSMVAPFVAGLSIHGYWVPSLVFSVAPLIGAAAAYCLPETKGKRLHDLLHE